VFHAALIQKISPRVFPTLCILVLSVNDFSAYFLFQCKLPYRERNSLCSPMLDTILETMVDLVKEGVARGLTGGGRSPAQYMHDESSASTLSCFYPFVLWQAN